MRRTKKVTISLPEDLLIQEAVRRELRSPDPAVIDAALARARAALDSSGRFDSAEMIRAERDARDARDRRR